MVYTELLRNGDAEVNNMEGWDKIDGDISGWQVQNDGYNGKKAFMTSLQTCRKCQMVDLYSAGLTKEYISKNTPEIIASVWVKASLPPNDEPPNCYVHVELRDKDMNTVEEWDTGILKVSDEWTELKHTFSSYKGSVRYVYWEDGNNEELFGFQLRKTYFSCLSLLIDFEKPVNFTPASPLVASEQYIVHFGEQSEKVSEKVMAIINNGNQFIDKEFPLSKGTVYSSDCTHKTEEFEWKRARDLFDEKPELFKDGTDANDIIQGKGGNCWFLSALSCLAENSHFMKNLFLTDALNEAGIYEFLMYKRGLPHRVVVDEYIPCIPNSKIPLFSRNKGNELWVLLLEKAYAKMHGSYSRLRGGLSSSAYDDLTGCPTLTYLLNFPSLRERIKSGEFFKEVQQFIKCGYMVSGSSIQGTGAEQSAQGIVYNHCYSLLAAEQIGTLQLVKLRNPWSEDVWTGPYNDNDTERWTDELKSAVKYVNANDGCFWMSFDDFSNNFQALTVAITDKHLYCFRVPVKYNKRNEAISYSVTITEPDTTIYIGIHQEDERFPGARPFIYAGAVLLPAANIKAKSIIDTFCVPRRCNSGFATLGPGTYEVLPYVYSSDRKKCINYKDSVCLSIHCTKPFTVEREKIPFYSARKVIFDLLIKSNPSEFL